MIMIAINTRFQFIHILDNAMESLALVTGRSGVQIRGVPCRVTKTVPQCIGAARVADRVKKVF
jgi:hypothetical protein